NASWHTSCAITKRKRGGRAHKRSRRRPQLGRRADLSRINHRSPGDVDVLSVHNLQDRGDAGSVADLVHSDWSGDSLEILERAETLTDLVAVAVEIGRLVGDARLLEAVLERVDDVV